MFERLVGIILPVFLIIALGFAYAKRTRPDMTWLNRINLNVLAPALIFSALSSKDFDLVANRALIVGAIGVVAGSGLLAWPFAKLLHEDVRTFVPPMMFNNCGNMGLPLAGVRSGRALGDGRAVHDLQSATVHDRRTHRQPARGILAGLAQSDGVLVGNLASLVFVPLGLTLALR